MAADLSPDPIFLLGGTGSSLEAPGRAVSHAELLEILAAAPQANVMFLPAGLRPDPLERDVLEACDVVTPILPRVTSDCCANLKLTIETAGWIAPGKLALRLFHGGSAETDYGLFPLLELAAGDPYLRWGVARTAGDAPPARPSGSRPVLTMRSKVLAVVPHYRSEEWLAECVSSLTKQTRPPDRIAVIDDGSGAPPIEIARSFPEVTLLAAPANMGPERILNDVIRSLDFDAYLVQDADDWCSRDRLRNLLREAERTNAELIGTQELRIYVETGKLMLRIHPLDVNREMLREPAHYVCHGTSLIGRRLALRAGGLDPDLEVVADTDFSMRASFLGRVVNLPEFHYYRRMRSGSRTSSPDTGFGSPRREAEAKAVFDRARRLHHAHMVGKTVDAAVKQKAGAVVFRHVLGPAIPAAGLSRSAIA